MVAPNITPPPQNPWDALLDELLADQQKLQTPVARFSARHDVAQLPGTARVPRAGSGVSPEPSENSAPSPITHDPSPCSPATYRDLIPLSAPQAGEQYAFEVDLDSCSGCKACVAGCHSLNGLDENETWRDVGLLVGGSPSHPFQQTVTTACHHCADPACLNGCPVLAYEKDPVTGIVRHLDDQCIGCSYCILKCPYDVPKYNSRLGIVRKCDMCHGRLAAGEAPACVQACPTSAIRIVTVNTSTITAEGRADKNFLPASPSPRITIPTTRYKSKKTLPAYLTAADADALRPAPPHWPLVIMLTLMPASIGLYSALAFTGSAGLQPGSSALSPSAHSPSHAALSAAAFALAIAGLLASVFHLGQPLKAWRIFLGLRRSWLSREAVLFGLWFPLAALTTALHFPQTLDSLAHSLGLPNLSPITHHLLPAIPSVATATLGIAALFCSAMIYIDTQRPSWRAAQTFTRFFGTAAIIGAALFSPLLSAAFLLTKLTLETLTLRHHRAASTHPDRQTARLQRGPLLLPTLNRYTFALLALPLLWQAPYAALVLLLLSELTERYLYFRTMTALKMPGVSAN